MKQLELITGHNKGAVLPFFLRTNNVNLYMFQFICNAYRHLSIRELLYFTGRGGRLSARGKKFWPPFLAYAKKAAPLLGKFFAPPLFDP